MSRTVILEGDVQIYTDWDDYGVSVGGQDVFDELTVLFGLTEEPPSQPKSYGNARLTIIVEWLGAEVATP